MTVGELLRKARKRRRKRQIDIANELGRTQPTISSWESDQTLPPARDARPVAKAYGLRPEQLLPRARAAKAKAA